MYLERGPFNFKERTLEKGSNLILRDKCDLDNGDIYYGFWYYLFHSLGTSIPTKWKERVC